MMVYTRRILIFVFTVAVLFTYQNCAPGHDEGSENWSSNDLPDGLDLEVSMAAFDQFLKPVLQQNCAVCHGAAQVPMFAATDTASAHNTLFTFKLVNMDDPSNSRLVTKIMAGHQSKPVSVANDIEQGISDWVAAIGGGVMPVPLEATFTSIKANILTPKCLSCHSPSGSRPSVNYTDYSSTMSTGKVIAGNALGSEIYKECASGSMPKGGTMLSVAELQALRDWIDAGAMNN